jgi:hypothetical protein
MTLQRIRQTQHVKMQSQFLHLLDSNAHLKKLIIDEMRNLSQKIILALPRKSMIRTTANRPKLPLS